MCTGSVTEGCLPGFDRLSYLRTTASSRRGAFDWEFWMYLDFEIPFLKFCSKTRNQKMDFNRSWWAPDFNSEKANQEIQIRISFPFHFSFLSMLLGNPKKRFAGTGETAVLSWEQFSNPFPLLPRRKNGEKWKSNDGFLGVKICFQVFGFRHCQFCKSEIRIFKSVKSRFFIWTRSRS